MTVLPTVYQVKGAPVHAYLCFRVTEWAERGGLLSLIPDTEEQNPFDVLTIFADDPRLSALAYEDAYPGSGAIASPDRPQLAVAAELQKGQVQSES